MAATCSIKAYHRQEERYVGLNLEYTQKEDRINILNAIEETKQKFDTQPIIWDNQKEDGSGGVYIEFNDDYDKESGPFYEDVLRKIGIDHCER
ncbi:MAG: hypothetical protein HXX81_07660 [Campylobacterales bacterium]|nr:hypothetical protein [Campylobacterales bacterium]